MRQGGSTRFSVTDALPYLHIFFDKVGESVSVSAYYGQENDAECCA